MIEILDVLNVKVPMKNYVICYVRYKIAGTIYYFPAALIFEKNEWKGYCYHDDVMPLIKEQLLLHYHLCS